jgi:hypothetical protein
MPKYWSLWIPEQYEHNFLHCLLRSELLFDMGVRYFHSVLWHLLFGSYWWIHDSSSVTMCLKKTSPSSWHWFRSTHICPHGYAYSVSRVVLEPTLHSLHRSEVCVDLIGRTMINLQLVCHSLVVTLLPSRINVMTCSVPFKSLCEIGSLIILHQWHLFSHLLTYKSIWTNFAAAHHCHHTVLMAFDVFPHIIHLQPIKTNHCMMLSLVRMVSGAAMLTLLVMKDNWMVKSLEYRGSVLTDVFLFSSEANHKKDMNIH